MGYMRTPEVLANSNFKRYLFGQFFYFPSIWIYGSSLMWVAYKLTDSPLLLGIAATSSSLPYLVFSAFAGSYADRLNRRLITLYTLILHLAQALAIAFLAFFGLLTYPVLIVFAVINGTLGAIQEPARLAFLNDMVGSEHLLTANGLGSVAFNVARIVGPIVAGFLLEVGSGWCFALSALLTLPSVIVFANMQVQSKPIKQDLGMLEKLMDGSRYVAKEKKPLMILVIISLSSAFGYGATIMIPAIASGILGLDSAGYGLLQSTVGAGALVAALSISFAGSRKNRMRTFTATAVLLPIVGLLISLLLLFAPSFWVGALYMFFGFAMVYQNVFAMALLPTVTHQDYIGRVMGFFSLSLSGLMPIGTMLAGIFSQAFTIPLTLVGSYVILLIFGSIASTSKALKVKSPSDTI